MIPMGSASDIMQTFTDKEIRAHFSKYDGWECQKAVSPAARDTVFLLTRNVRGRKETVALAVSFDEEPTTTALGAVAAGYKGRNALKGQYLLVPKNANVSEIPGHIGILSMSSFGFTEGQLIWLTKKKGAKHYASMEEPAKITAASVACQPHAA
jgi:hypothetical protein